MVRCKYRKNIYQWKSFWQSGFRADAAIVNDPFWYHKLWSFIASTHWYLMLAFYCTEGKGMSGKLWPILGPTQLSSIKRCEEKQTFKFMWFLCAPSSIPAWKVGPLERINKESKRLNLISRTINWYHLTCKWLSESVSFSILHFDFYRQHKVFQFKTDWKF